MLKNSILRTNRIHLTTSTIRSCSAKPLSKSKKTSKVSPHGGPSFQHFLANSDFQTKSQSIRRTPEDVIPYINEDLISGQGQKVYLDVYGCQMNVNDTEVVWSILESKGYSRTLDKSQADVWLLVTCSIREGAESKVWNNLQGIRNSSRQGLYKKSLRIGLLGCMAERLKDKMLSTDLVDIVAGPDSYRDLPRLLAITEHSSQAAINVMLSLEETYADVKPSRLNQDSVTGFVSIQRGCDNMCAYCIVPFTRGRERSRPLQTILDEVKYLVDSGVKEVTLLGQNVNSYRDNRQESLAIFNSKFDSNLAKGFKTVYKPKLGGLRFADLLEKVSEIDPELRIRFTSPHPKDFPDEVLYLIKEKSNICNQLHLPAQSGSTKILENMRRGYSRESYLELVDHVKSIIPGVRLTGDMIAGFCGETDQDFQDTLSLIEKVKYGQLYTFSYSMREKTSAHRKLKDDVEEKVKLARTAQMSDLTHSIAKKMNEKLIGTQQLVLIEGDSKRSKDHFQGRSDGYIKTILPKSSGLKPGDYVQVQITDATSLTLKGSIVKKSSIREFNK